MGVNIAYVTLHVGLGTFRPVKTDDITEHKMHSEHYYIKKEDADKINQADAMIFQVEKALKENGDKLPADKKGEIESALKELKDAHAAKNISAIDAASEKLNTVFQAASADMYSQGQSGQQGASQNQSTSNDNKNNQDGEVTDTDFEEVK